MKIGLIFPCCYLLLGFFFTSCNYFSQQRGILSGGINTQLTSPFKSTVKQNHCDNIINGYQPPKLLSNTCLYQNNRTHKINSQLKYFTPNFQLWSDGASKKRWIFIPQNKQINTSNQDHWIFPVGTQLFKEFSKTIIQGDGTKAKIRVETRHMIKISSGKGEESWQVNTYEWQPNQEDAFLSPGNQNVLGTQHDIPSKKDCVACHKGEWDMILGFSAIQLSSAQLIKYNYVANALQQQSLTLKQLILENIISHPPNSIPKLPGDSLTQKAIGYFHANCGHCHNPSGHAAEREAGHLQLRYDLGHKNIEQTHVYQTAVNQPTKNFTDIPWIIHGAFDNELDIFKSAIFIRMNSLEEENRMPMLAAELVDPTGTSIIHKWLMTLDPP